MLGNYKSPRSLLRLFISEVKAALTRSKSSVAVPYVLQVLLAHFKEQTESLILQADFKMKRKMDITSYFCTKKMNNNEADIETEPDGVKRAEEKQVESTTESEQEDLGDTGFQREGTEQERETDENPESEEAESEIQAECETQTENICASTSTGPSDISKCKEDPPMQPDLKLTVNIPQIHYERREIKQFGCTEHRV
ncbi:hypothetical protein MHYP_G00110680 [Metynnis hypsauchen]